MATYIALRSLNRSAHVRVPSETEVGAPGSLAKSVTATTGTFTAGTYYWVVSAVGSGGGETTVSNEVSQAVTGPTNEVQSVKVDATAGQYKLTFNGQQTADLAFDATSGTVQTALRGLSSINGANVTVTGGPGDSGGTTPYTVTFIGTLGNQNVPALTAQAGTTPLSGGGAAVTITTPTPGRGSDVVHLTWTTVLGAASYNVYRGTSAGAENKKIGNTSSLLFDDTGTAGTTATPPSTDTAVSASGLVTLSPTLDAVVDLDDVKVRRALGQHRAIGQYVVTAANNSTASAGTLPANS
jgi:hypothetical protein